MIHRIVPLIAYVALLYLKAGDVILTGTRKAWGRCTAVTSWRSASTAWRSLPACCKRYCRLLGRQNFIGVPDWL